MTTEVGSGQVAIFPTFVGFRKAIGDQTDAAATSSSSGFGKIWQKSSAAIGRSSGAGFASTFNASVGTIGAAATKKLQSEVAVASRSLSAARLKEQDAAGKVRVAEAALTEAYAKGVAGSSKVVAAEERLASAQRANSATQDTAAAATARLTAAQSALAEATAAANVETVSSSRNLLGNLFKGTASAGASAGAAIGSGFAKTFKAALSPLVGLVAGYIGFQIIRSGFEKLTSTVKESVSVMSDWAVIQAQTNAFIKSTGGVAKVTGTQVHSLSLSIENLTGTQAEAVQQGANIIGTFKNIRNAAGKGNDIFNQTTLAAVNMARAMGLQVPQAALQLSKAINDPSKGLAKLTRQGVTFTQQQKDEIDALTKAGKVMQAQKITLAEVNSEFGASGVEFRQTIPGAVGVFQTAVQQAQIKLTTGLTPAILKVINLGTQVVDTFANSHMFQGIIKGLDGFATDATAKVGKVVGLFDTLDSSSKGITFKGVVSGFEKIFPSLKPFLSLLNIVAPILATVVKLVGPQLAKAVQQILPSLAQLIIAILPIIPPLVQLAVQVIPLLTSAAKVLVPVLSFLVTEVLEPMFEAFNDVIKLLTGNTSLAQFGVQAQKIGGGVGILNGIIKTVIDSLLGFFKGLFTWFGQAISNVKSFLGTVIAVFTSLPGVIGGALSGAGKWLVGAGKSIIDGLLKGVTNAAKGIGSFFASIGKDALNGMKSALGIHSPSTVFQHEVGDQIVAGLVKGVNGGALDVNAAVSRLVSVRGVAASVASSSGISSPVTSPSKTGSGNVYIDKIVAPDQNPVVSGRVMGREFVRLMAGTP